MQHDRLYLIDMVKAADAVAAFVAGHDRNSFVDDDMLRSAVQKKLEIMGEAARALSDDIKNRYPEVPWRSMVALRNTAVHQYFSIDWDLIWATATQHVPGNRIQIAAILAAEFPDSSNIDESPA